MAGWTNPGAFTAIADGTRRVYSLNAGGFLKLGIWIDQFWEG